MIPRMTSFAYTPAASVPVTSMRRTASGSSARHCDARTSRTCDVPIPNASAPNAPCVDVWLSPQAIVIPGCVRPSSGPMTCTMPCSAAPRSWSGMPKSRQFFWSDVSISSAEESANGRATLAVGMMWSTVATVRDGNGTLHPLARSISKACGLVTSWTRCRPTKSCVCPVASFRTVWRSQTLENSVRPMGVSVAKGGHYLPARVGCSRHDDDDEPLRAVDAVGERLLDVGGFARTGHENDVRREALRPALVAENREERVADGRGREERDVERRHEREEAWLLGRRPEDERAGVGDRAPDRREARVDVVEERRLEVLDGAVVGDERPVE